MVEHNLDRRMAYYYVALNAGGITVTAANLCAADGANLRAVEKE